MSKSQLLDIQTRKSCVLPGDTLTKARELITAHQPPWSV